MVSAQPENKPEREKGFEFTIVQKVAWSLLVGPALFVLLYGGSRSGKTAIIIANIFMRAIWAPGSRHLIARFRFNHAKTSLWYDTMPKVAKLMGIQHEVRWNQTDFVCRIGESEIWLTGLDDKERLEKILGTEYATIYINEASQVSYDAIEMVLTRLAQKTTLQPKLIIDCNPPTKRHWIYKLFILKRDPKENVPLAKPDNYVEMQLNPADNVMNIGETYMDILASMSARARKRFEKGLFGDDVEGALFKQEDIDRNREDVALNLTRIGVSVDPSITADEGSDECGLMVGGVDDGASFPDKLPHGYILEDCSAVMTPGQWGQKAVDLYNDYQADFIVAEANQGGLMVKHTIHTIDPNIKVYLVHASKSKIARAEPVSALYEQGRVHHVGIFTEYEEQLTTYTGKDGEKSPDRYDAGVWLLTKLMLRSPHDEASGPSAPKR